VRCRLALHVARPRPAIQRLVGKTRTRLRDPTRRHGGKGDARIQAPSLDLVRG
jgi:hypothetical protein